VSSLHVFNAIVHVAVERRSLNAAALNGFGAMRTDVIDLRCLCRWHEAVPIEDCVGAMADLARGQGARHQAV